MGSSTLTSGNALWARLVSLLVSERRDKAASPEMAPPERAPRHLVKRLCAVQFTCVGALFWLSQHKTLGILFPLVLALLPPLRRTLGAFNIIPEHYLKVFESDGK